MIETAWKVAVSAYYLAGCVLWLGPVLTFCIVRDYLRDEGVRDLMDRLAKEQERR